MKSTSQETYESVKVLDCHWTHVKPSYPRDNIQKMIASTNTIEIIICEDNQRIAIWYSDEGGASDKRTLNCTGRLLENATTLQVRQSPKHRRRLHNFEKYFFLQKKSKF